MGLFTATVRRGYTDEKRKEDYLIIPHFDKLESINAKWTFIGDIDENKLSDQSYNFNVGDVGYIGDGLYVWNGWEWCKLDEHESRKIFDKK